MSDGDASYRVVTDPSEGPKQFTIQTRVTSRGETAVILMGVDCAERVMCHESAPFDLEEGHFVFKLGPGTAGILDQLLAQGRDLPVGHRRLRVISHDAGRHGEAGVLRGPDNVDRPFDRRVDHRRAAHAELRIGEPALEIHDHDAGTFAPADLAVSVAAFGIIHFLNSVASHVPVREY